MTANTVGSWFKRWGLWLLLGLAVVLVIIAKLLPSNGSKPEILQKAKDEVQGLKDQAKKELDEHKAKMKANEDELARIKAIEDEEARLKALAEFADSRR
jgi:hypothetical protein